jgi:C4-dicarboxylate-specific signal transduction histidine kinase
LKFLPEGNQARECAEAVEQIGWRAKESVRRLLEFSQPSPDSYEWISVNQTIDSALGLVGNSIEAMGVKLQVDIDEGIPPVWANSRQLVDLWVNLFLIAKDATRENTKCTIGIKSTGKFDDQIALSVYDDGKIIPSDQLESLFKPNFVGPKGGRGTGLEFSICQEIVRSIVEI